MQLTSKDNNGMRYFNRIEQIHSLTEADQKALSPVTQRYAFRATEYYLGLINWSDPDDPLRKIVVPDAGELEAGGELDACNEAAHTVAHGVQHKYADTALLLCNEVCGAYCRYCFRKRLFMDGNDETSKDVSAGIAYIAAHPEISHVLLTGGDPLVLGTHRLIEIMGKLYNVPHVRVIRIGSKMLAFNPGRILDDGELQAWLGRNSTHKKRIYLMAHFDHPNELTDEAVRAIETLTRCGVVVTNQCPILRGINDDAGVLAELFERLTGAGCPPYYLFQGRPTAGNQPFALPIVSGWKIFQEAQRRLSGLSRRARFVMSHASGKIEVTGIDDARIYLRYHRAKSPADEGRLLICRRDDQAFWLDDLEILPDTVHAGACSR